MDNNKRPGEASGFAGFFMYCNEKGLSDTELLLNVDKYASGFFVMARRRPAGLLAARLRTCGFASLAFSQTDLVKSKI